MSFVEYNKERIKFQSLLSLRLDTTHIDSVFEELCYKFDILEQRIHKSEEILMNKAEKGAFEAYQKEVNDKLDELFQMHKSNTETTSSLHIQLVEANKKQKEEMEYALNRCLIDAGNLVRTTLSQDGVNLQPTAPAQNITYTLPDYSGIIKESEEKSKKVEALEIEISHLKEKQMEMENFIQKLQKKVEEIPKYEERIPNNQLPIIEATPMLVPETPFLQLDRKTNASFIDSSRFQDLQTELRSIRHFAEEETQQLRKEISINNSKTQTTTQSIIAELRESNTTNENQYNRIMERLSKADKNIEEVKSSIVPLIEHKTIVDDNIADLRKQISNIVISPISTPEPVIISSSDSNTIDLSPITTQIHIHDSQIKLMMNRVEAVERKDTVSPSILQSVTSSISNKIDGLNELIKQINESSKRERERIDKRISEESTKTSESIADTIDTLERNNKTIEDIKRRVLRLEKIVDEIKTQIDDAPDPVDENTINRMVQAVTSLKNDLDKSISNIRSLQENNNELNERVEVLGSKASALASTDYSSDIKHIRSEMSDIWNKFGELANTIQETKDDFLPKSIELSKVVPEKTRTQLVERSILPRIVAPVKNPADEIKLNDTANKVEKQEGLLYQLKRAVDQHQKALQVLDESKADKTAAQALFEQFRIALGELNNRIGSLKKALVSKADSTELYHAINQLIQKDSTETASGVEPIKCLCCGRPKSGVIGAIDDPNVTKQIPTPVSTRVIGEGEGQVCFVYGDRGDMYIGRCQDGKSRVFKTGGTEILSSRTNKI